MEFGVKWEAVGNDAPEFYETMARLSFTVNGNCLTRNEDIWSRTIKDDVLVSMYPLATWFASSWWRLLHEPHPGNGVRPSVSWRMAHELSAANHGFVCPTIMFATDGEGIQVWSSSSNQNAGQSVRYLSGLSSPYFVPMLDFRTEASRFIGAVLDRLRDSNIADSELSDLWGIVCEEEASPDHNRRRRFEAMMGYDPEECPESLLQGMVNLTGTVGESSLSELMAALATGKAFQDEQEKEIKHFSSLSGLDGKPDIPQHVFVGSETARRAPWELAVQDANNMRGYFGTKLSERITNESLYDVLGISSAAADRYKPENRSKVSVAVPTQHNQIRFMPRKKHPTAKRFEYARLLADCVFQKNHGDGWLVSSDLSTFRQKYQRAFAAELLCPIEGVKELMQGDYSESAIEDASEYFGVSTTTVTSLLTNNHLIESGFSSSGNGAWPYSPMVA